MLYIYVIFTIYYILCIIMAICYGIYIDSEAV